MIIQGVFAQSIEKRQISSENRVSGSGSSDSAGSDCSDYSSGSADSDCSGYSSGSADSGCSGCSS